MTNSQHSNNWHISVCIPVFKHKELSCLFSSRWKTALSLFFVVVVILNKKLHLTWQPAHIQVSRTVLPSIHAIYCHVFYSIPFILLYFIVLCHYIMTLFNGFQHVKLIVFFNQLLIMDLNFLMDSYWFKYLWSVEITWLIPVF